jgi:putative ABC transport system permease protein
MNGFYLSALQLALCLTPMALGIFISMKVFRIPDITTDGSYTLGASVGAILLTAGYPLVWVVLGGIFSGVLAGMTTGWVHTKFRIEPLLSGILVMTALYSINLMIMGRSNVPLIGKDGLFSIWNDQWGEEIGGWISSISLVGICCIGLWYLLKTDFGIAMRASGNNPAMSEANGMNNDRVKIIGLGMANGLTALSGVMVSQYEGFADINMGIGIVITGLGAVLISDTIRRWLRLSKIGIQILLVLLGTIIFQSVLAITLSIGVDPNSLKLVTALFVLLIVGLPRFISKKQND